VAAIEEPVRAVPANTHTRACAHVFFTCVFFYIINYNTVEDEEELRKTK